MRIVIACVGSLGDVYPLLAIGSALKARGADITFAAPAIYAAESASSGLQHAPIGPSDNFVDSIGYAGCSLLPGDTQAIVERLCISDLSEHVEQLHAVSEPADAVVAPFQFVAAQMVAEMRGIPLVSCVYSPAFISRQRQRQFRIPPHWHTEVAKARRHAGLPRRILPYTAFPDNVALVLGLFPQFLISETPCAPRLKIVGFPYRDAEVERPDEELLDFCQRPTVTFSFGSYADACNSRMYLDATIEGSRAVELNCLYLSQHIRPEWIAATNSHVLHRAYLPHETVFPLAGFVVHHGGLGTLMAACRHRKPMLVVPFLHDQPYHAERMQELIGADIIPATRYSGATLAEGLRRLERKSEDMRCRLSTLAAACAPNASETAAQAIFELL